MSKRPGGLTALAVLNFVFGGLGALGLLAVWALIAVAKAAIDEAGGMGALEGAGYEGPGVGMLYFMLLLGLAGVVLMIASGVGYLKQKKFLGRTLGNAYAGVSLLSTVVGLVAGTGFGLSTIIGLIYPTLTLILLNNTFKDDFVNP